MSKSYKNMMKHPIDEDRVVVFQRRQANTENWYVRIRRVDGGYVLRSCKTTKFGKAMEIAREIYLKMLLAEQKGVYFGRNTFNKMFKEFVSELNASKARRKRIQHVFDRYLSEYFNAVTIESVTDTKIRYYFDWRVTYWQRKEDEGNVIPHGAKKIASENTIKSERQILKQFMLWCKDKGYIASVPRMVLKLGDGAVNNEKTRGKAMSMKLMNTIDRILLEDARCGANKNVRFARMRLYYYNKIVYHTLLRPIDSEMGAMKWKDIMWRKSKDTEGAMIANIKIRIGKKKSGRFATATYKGTLFLLRWRALCMEIGFGGDDDYVIPNHDGSQCPSWHIGTTLRKRLMHHGLRYMDDGSKVTLYSWRASAITNRLVYSGWGIERVANASDTSIQAISQSYYYEVQTQNPDRFANQFKDRVMWSKENRDETNKLMKKIKKEVKK